MDLWRYLIFLTLHAADYQGDTVKLPADQLLLNQRGKKCRQYVSSKQLLNEVKYETAMVLRIQFSIM